MVLRSSIVKMLKLHNTRTLMHSGYIFDKIDQINNSFIKTKIKTTKLYIRLRQHIVWFYGRRVEQFMVVVRWRKRGWQTLTGQRSHPKKETKKEANADKNKVDKKRESETPCTVTIVTSPSVSLRQTENLKYGKDSVSGEGGFLVTQERMIDTDTAKVDTNAKADAPDASDAS